MEERYSGGRDPDSLEMLDPDPLKDSYLHFDLRLGNLIVDGGEILGRQVLRVIDPAVHLDVLLLRHLVLHLQPPQRNGIKENSRDQCLGSGSVGSLYFCASRISIRSVSNKFGSGSGSFPFLTKVLSGLK
jgi:hypothetical protein